MLLFLTWRGTHASMLVSLHHDLHHTEPELADEADGVQVLERIKDPLMTLLSRDHFETAYAVLCHFHLIAQRAPIIFSQVCSSILTDYCSCLVRSLCIL